MADIILLIYFFGIITTATLGGIFGYLIFKATHGATKGWKFLAMYGFGNTAMSFIGILRNVFPPKYTQIILLFQAMTIMFISVVVVLTVTRFIRDFGLPQKYMNQRNILVVLISLFVIVVLYNISNFNSLWPQQLYSIACLILALSYFSAIPSVTTLARVTKRTPWYLMMVGFLFAGMVIIPVYSGGCCEPNGILTGQGISCGPYEGIFLNIIPQLCHPNLGAVYMPGLFLTLVGGMLIVISEIFFWFKLARPKKIIKSEVSK